MSPLTTDEESCPASIHPTPYLARCLDLAGALKRLRDINEWLDTPHPNGGVWLDHIDDAFMRAWDAADTFGLIEVPDAISSTRLLEIMREALPYVERSTMSGSHSTAKIMRRVLSGDSHG